MRPTDIIMNKMGFPDPILGAEAGFEPFSQYEDELKNDVTIAPEVRKYMSLNQPELQNIFNPVVDEDSRQKYIDSNELRKRLFEAKWEWHKDRTLGQFKATTMEIEEEKAIAEDYDRWMKPRVEFMYNYMDFDNERHKMRDKFLNQMHKKTTVKDIGEKLDEFIWSSKAATMLNGHWDDATHTLEQPASPQKDLG